MVITDPDIIKDIKSGTANPIEVEKWLLNNVPATRMAHELAEMLIESQGAKPIVVTQDQFFAHFRIQGYRFVDGQIVPETRGNFSKREK